MKKTLFATLLLTWGASATVQAADQFLWLEAETGAELNPVVVKSDLGASQSIYLAPWKWPDYSSRSADDGLITFDVYIPEPGDYKLWARVRLPNTGSKPYDVSSGSGDTNDASQWKPWLADTRPDPRGWGWSDSGFRQTFTQGMHTLHLLQREGGPGVHLDKILLTNVASYVPAGAGAPESRFDIENPYRSSVVEKYGQLRLVGNQLSDKNGQAVQLQGISAHGLQWFPLVENQTIPYMAEFFGAEAVRLAMYIEDYAPTDPSDFWGGFMADRTNMMVRTERAINDAVKAGVYVLVDWHIHNTPGKYTNDAAAFFGEISRKYGHLPNVIYEICNEPVSVTWSSGIKPYASTVINAIRQNDPDNVIIVGTPNWSQDVDVAARDPLAFGNIMYAFHFYAATHDINTMKSKVDAALSAGAAVFVSEWGSSDVGTSRSNFPVAQQWMDYMNQRKLSWVNWSLGNKDESSSILKPRTPMSGPWTSADLTQAGAWLKPYFDAPNAATSSSSNSSSSASSSGGISSSSSSTSSSSSGSGGSSSGNLVFEAENSPIAMNVTPRPTEGTMGYFDAGDHFGFRGVDWTGANQLIVRYGTSKAGGVAEIRVDSPYGQLLATLSAANTGSYAIMQDFSFNIGGISGVHDLYVVGVSGSGIFNMDKVTLIKSGSNSSSSSTSSSSSSSSSSSGTTSIGGAAACNDSNSTVLAAGSYTMAPAKCYKYNHTTGRLQLGVWSGVSSVKYEVKNCSGLVISNISQIMGGFVGVSTQTNNCNHYIFVKDAPNAFTVQVGSWQ